MVKANSKAQYRRLLLIYSLVIIVPGAFLSILAYRGIQGNWVAEEKIRDDRLDRKTTFFIGGLEATIDDYLEAFSSDHINWDDRFISLQNNSRADTLVKEGAVLAVVGWQPDSLVKLLDQTTLFLPDRFWKKSGSGSKAIDQLIRGQELEINDEDLPRALMAYKDLQNSTHDPVLRIHALCGQARIRRGQGDFKEAELLYQQLFKLAEDSVVQRLMLPGSFNMVGEIINEWLHQPSEDNNKAIPHLVALEVITFLGMPQLYLTESNYLVLHDQLEQLYRNSLKESYENESAIQLIELLFSQCEIKIMRGTMLNLLFNGLKNNLEKDRETFGKAMPPPKPYYEDSLSVLICFKINPEYNIALLLDTRELIRRNIEVLEETTGFAKKIVWRVENEYDQLWFSHPGFDDEKYTRSFNPVRFGAWTLKLQEVNKSILTMIWEAGQQFYLLGFIFVIVAMTLGLFRTIRSLTRDYRLSRLKSDFVSTVSHEFKSPLTSIRMMSERLANQKVNTDARKQDYYNSMLAQSERLSHLVENILDFSRMDEGRKTYQFAPCSLMKLAEEVVDYMTIRHKEMGYIIDLNGDENLPHVMVDCQSIHQVLYNLIDNAIKYSGDSRKIMVSLESHDEMVEVVVQDYGI